MANNIDMALLKKQLSALAKTLINLSSDVFEHCEENSACFEICEKIDTASLSLLTIVKRINKNSPKTQVNIEKVIDELMNIEVLLASAERTVKAELQGDTHIIVILESCVDWLDSEIEYLAD